MTDEPGGDSGGDPAGDPAPVEATVRDYYDALRRGEPLYPYFVESGATAKVGVGETLLGYDATAEALREQTRTTDDWSVESHRLRAGRRGALGWFSDLVSLSWTGAGDGGEDGAGGDPRPFDTRWTGALTGREGEWSFVELHVSVAHDPETGGAAGFGTDVVGEDGGHADQGGER